MTRTITIEMDHVPDAETQELIREWAATFEIACKRLVMVTAEQAKLNKIPFDAGSAVLAAILRNTAHDVETRTARIISQRGAATCKTH